MISILIEREFGIKYSIKYIPELLKRLGFSWQKGRFEAALADAEKRADWMANTWPKILEQARRNKGYLLFEDEASFALWGSLSYTWARRGIQPVVKTSGKRKCYKMFGLIDYFTGKVFHQGVEGQLDSESYIEFLMKLKTKTRKHLNVIHDGAPYHASADVVEFIESENRLDVYQLPSYSPDFNPIEKLWKKVKGLVTHMVYIAEFDELVIRVEAAMDFLSRNPEEVLKLFRSFKKLESAPAKA
jgi:hypothetical protein